MEEKNIQEQSDIAIKEKDNLEQIEIENKESNIVEELKENVEIQIRPEKNHKKLKITLITISIIFFVIAVLSVIFAILNIKNENMIKGVFIANIDVSDMSKEKTKESINEIFTKMQENEIFLKHGEFESTTTFEALEVKYKIEEAIDQAYQIGRKGNLFIDNYEILRTMIENKNIEIDFTISQEMVNQIAQNINNSIEGAVVQPDYSIDNNRLIISKGIAGYTVEENKLSQEIYSAVKEGKTKTIEIPLIMVQPEEINIEKIHEEVYKEVKDAYYTKDPFTIYPESNGIDFDIEQAKDLLTEDKTSYEIPLKITKPSKTTKDIGTEASPDKLSTCSTNYLASNVNRTTNLKLAASKINGIVLLPGEEFSYNKTVGERTTAAGFKEAAIFNAGKVENGLGGGICQISSTLYDAVVMADLTVTVRRNHQFVTSYLPAGKDATVVWGAQDFKFKNTREYPIRIKATVQGGVATVEIWGVKQEVEYDITIETKKVATIEYTTQYIQDASLPAGQQKVEQQGSNGRKVEAYKVKKLNGKVVSRTLLSKDTYNAMKKIVRVGVEQ